MKEKQLIKKALIGASVPAGLEQIKFFSKLKLGNIVLTDIPEEKNEALAFAEYCRKNKIRLIFSELMKRGCHERKHGFKYSKKDFDDIRKAVGEYYVGRYAIGEAGGVLYWPEQYTKDRRAGGWQNLPSCRNVAEAHSEYIKYLKDFIDYERDKVGGGKLLNVESSILCKYHIEAGIDMLCLEMVPGDPFRIIPAVRGAAKASDKAWGVHIAMEYYGGARFDALWKKRWKTSLYYAWISGANFIYPESGHYVYSMFRKKGRDDYGFGHREMKEVRQILREAWRFSEIHERPEKGPETRIGIMHGKHDGAPGLWNPYAWGQYDNGEEWKEGPAEKAWEFTDKIYKGKSCEYVCGKYDFTGNPPCGQYDVVPVEASLKKLKSYKCLLFLGWNNMTEGIYSKLKSYVESGGHLIMWLSHLNTETRRDKRIKLFRNGNFKDLFGVEVKGFGKTRVTGLKFFRQGSLKSYKFPVLPLNSDPRFIGKMTPANLKMCGAELIAAFADFFSDTLDSLQKKAAVTENRLGKGLAYLVCAEEYPCADGMMKLSESILWTVMNGEQADIRICSSDKVRYAVYEEKKNENKYKVIYLLNTCCDISQAVRIWYRGKLSGEIMVAACDIKLAFLIKELIIVPETKNVKLSSLNMAGNNCGLEFYSPEQQNVEIFNMGKKQSKISVNSSQVTIEPGEHSVLKYGRRTDPEKKEFYSKDFLDEKDLKWKHCNLPY